MPERISGLTLYHIDSAEIRTDRFWHFFANEKFGQLAAKRVRLVQKIQKIETPILCYNIGVSIFLPGE